MFPKIYSLYNYYKIESYQNVPFVTHRDKKVYVVAGAILGVSCTVAYLCFSATWKDNCVSAASRKLSSLWHFMQSFIGEVPPAIAYYPPEVRLNLNPDVEKIKPLLEIVKACQLESEGRGAFKLAYAIGVRAGLGISQHRGDYDALLNSCNNEPEELELVRSAITFSAITAGVTTPQCYTSSLKKNDPEESFFWGFLGPDIIEEISNSLKIKALSTLDLVAPEELSKIIRWLDGNDDKACQAIARLIPNMNYLKGLVDVLLGPKSRRQGSQGFFYELDAPYFDALAGIHRVLGKESPSWFPEWIEFLKKEGAVTPFVGYLFMGEVWLGHSSLVGYIHEPPPGRTVEITLQWMKKCKIRLATMGRFLNACVSRKFLSASRVETVNGGFSLFNCNGSYYNTKRALYDVAGFSSYSNNDGATAYFRHRLLTRPHEFSNYLDELERQGGCNALISGINQVAAMIESGNIDGCSLAALPLADRVVNMHHCESQVPKLCKAFVALGKAQGKQMRSTFKILAERKNDCSQARKRPIGITAWIAQSQMRWTDDERSFWHDGAALLTHVEKCCNELNDKLHPGVRQDITIFMATYEAAIMCLAHVVGVDEAKCHLNHYLSLNGFSPLKRFLALQRIPGPDDLAMLRQIYTSLRETSSRKKQKTKGPFVRSSEWQRVLVLYNSFCQLNASKQFNSITVESFTEEDSLSLVLALEKRVSAILFNEFKKRLGIADQVSGIAKKSTIENVLAVAKVLPVLLQGRDFLAHQFPYYREIFDALSLRMIRGDTPEAIFAFLTDCNQEDKLGQTIAIHNTAIADRLKGLGVNFNIYWQGMEPKSFTLKTAGSDPQSVRDDRSRELSSALVALLSLSQEYSQTVKKNENAPLKKKVEGLSNLFKKIFRGLGIKETEKIEAESFYKKVGDRSKKLSTLDVLSGQLAKAIEEASKIDRDPVIHSARIGKRNLTEVLGHAMDAVKGLKETVKTPQKISFSSKEGRGPFQVRVWNRAPLHCLGIGKQVNCCLSPDSGSQFQALIERYVDGGMNVVEVIDKDGVAVSLAWLFLAESKEKDKDQGVDLVINFLEMDPNVQKNRTIRDCILGELLDYTKQLAKEIGANRLLARSQDYSGLPNYEAPTVDVSLQKVGETLFRLPYYLEAEKRSSLHLLWERAT